MTLILSNGDAEKILSMPDVIVAFEQAYVELREGKAVTRTRANSYTKTSRSDAAYCLKSMDGIVPSLGVGAVRINSDLITSPKDKSGERKVKVPSAPGGRYVGLILLFSSETGEPLAIFPDGVLQRMRVGAASGLGAKYLAREDARTVGMLGAGWQAGSQLMAVCAVRNVETVRVFSPTKANREAFAAEWSARQGVKIVPVDSPEAAMKGADIAICATNTLVPVFFERWVEPGMHMSSIKRQEIEPAAVRRADIIAVHSRDGKPIIVMAKDVHVAEYENEGKEDKKDRIDYAPLPTLPDLITGNAPKRTSPEQITCFLNNIGLGFQFAAVGGVFYQRAKAAGLGRELPTDWFTEDVHP
jgi:ornithine cyclodeaminase/alanine dehydrogenase-like protein (mu-crystallin family)